MDDIINDNVYCFELLNTNMESLNDLFTYESNFDADQYLNSQKIKQENFEDTERFRQISLNESFDYDYFDSDNKFDTKREIEDEEFITSTDYTFNFDNLSIDGNACINDDVQSEIDRIINDDNLNNITTEDISCHNDNSDGNTIEPTVEDDQEQNLNSEQLSSSSSTIINDDAIVREKINNEHLKPKTQNEPKFDSALDENIKKLLFPEKLWRLIQDQSIEGINWSKNGKEIIINIEKIRPILSLISRSTKIQSFIRQLHLYKFRKTNNFNLKKRKLDRNIICYYREGFSREVVENIESLAEIFGNDKKK